MDFQDQYKQAMMNEFSNKRNKVKNPNWQEAEQLAIYKRSRDVELGATEQHQLVVRAGFKPATYGFQIRRSNHSATLPPSICYAQREVLAQSNFCTCFTCSKQVCQLSVMLCPM